MTNINLIAKLGKSLKNTKRNENSKSLACRVELERYIHTRLYFFALFSFRINFFLRSYKYNHWLEVLPLPPSLR